MKRICSKSFYFSKKPFDSSLKNEVIGDWAFAVFHDKAVTLASKFIIYFVSIQAFIFPVRTVKKEGSYPEEMAAALLLFTATPTVASLSLHSSSSPSSSSLLTAHPRKHLFPPSQGFWPLYIHTNKSTCCYNAWF